MIAVRLLVKIIDLFSILFIHNSTLLRAVAFRCGCGRNVAHSAASLLYNVLLRTTRQRGALRAARADRQEAILFRAPIGKTPIRALPGLAFSVEVVVELTLRLDALWAAVLVTDLCHEALRTDRVTL
uniref:Putative secreted protein n=1 Tax=Anopheles marajoara TaxID=58244 RepID=A0A2M4C832_9DIPT